MVREFCGMYREHRSGTLRRTIPPGFLWTEYQVHLTNNKNIPHQPILVATCCWLAFPTVTYLLFPICRSREGGWVSGWEGDRRSLSTGGGARGLVLRREGRGRRRADKSVAGRLANIMTNLLCPPPVVVSSRVPRLMMLSNVFFFFSLFFLDLRLPHRGFRVDAATCPVQRPSLSVALIRGRVETRHMQ